VDESVANTHRILPSIYNPMLPNLQL
jgi:hypothetical protein